MKKERQYLIVPLTKSPHPVGRYGRRESQDWYKALLKAVVFSDELDAGILIISAVHVSGAKPEADYYIDALRELGLIELGLEECLMSLDQLSRGKFFVIRDCQETIGQIERVDGICQDYDRTPIFVSTWTHYLRVRYLARGVNAIHHGVFGIPRLVRNWVKDKIRNKQHVSDQTS